MPFEVDSILFSEISGDKKDSAKICRIVLARAQNNLLLLEQERTIIQEDLKLF